MIVGHGDIAKALKDREGALFFASGVSNSSCEDKSEFKREKTLLLDQPKDNCLFYFSTISIDYKDSPYTRHKQSMERLIRSNWNHYNILRIGNITWGTNPNTFINYLRNRKKMGLSIEYVDQYRYIIDKDQLRVLCASLPLKGQHELSVFKRMVKPKDIV